ncbi:hypothetical protein [Clostridium cellulovorans]|nr:hypothetical protein [Clostridium cellulovorans]
MNKKNVFSSLLVIVLVFNFLAGVYFSAFIQPKIVFRAEITKVSGQDYERILNDDHGMYANKDIEKFRHIRVEIKVIEPIGIENDIQIERDNLEKYLKNNKLQVIGGGLFEYGEGKEYEENSEIYLSDISENELRNILQDFRYKVTWKDCWNKENDKVFYFRDYVK